MKIKCDDGVTRDFSIANTDSGSRYGGVESKCQVCGHMFGVHDTKILKPRWKQHVCEQEDIEKRKKHLAEQASKR